MKKEQIIAIKFAVLLLIVFFGHAFTFALLIPYLNDLGYGAMQQGWIFALGAILTISGQFLFGYLCDRFKTDKIMFYISSIIFAVVNWLLYSFSDNPVALVILWASMVNAFFRIVQGILDAWIIESDKYCLDNYGAIRAFGAIGWTIGAQVMVYFFNRWGYSSLGTSFFLFTLISLVMCIIIPDAQKTASDSKLGFSDVKKLLTNRNFLILTMVFFCLFIITNSDIYTTIGKMTALNATTEEISWKWSFQAICELPLFFLGGWCVKKFGAIKVILFAIVMCACRFTLSALATSPFQLVAISAFQAVTFPLIMICSKQLIDEVSPSNLRAGGQQISSSIYIGGSMLITPIICGYLVEAFSYNFTLFLVAFTCVIPISLLLYYNKQGKKE